MFTIAICGGSKPETQGDLKFPYRCGVELAKAGDYRLLYGACGGAPHACVQGFIRNRKNRKEQRVIGLSPFFNKKRHKRKRYPIPRGIEINFTGMGIARSIALVERAHAVVCFEGALGTLLEVIAGVCYRRPLLIQGISKGLHATSDLFFNLTKCLFEAERWDIRYFYNPKDLIEVLSGIQPRLDDVPDFTW